LVHVPEILLIEPDGQILDRLVVLMQDAGFEVLPACDFQDAVALLRSRTFHAIVAAQRLGTHNGLHLLLRARREHPAVIAIVMSRCEDPVLVREAAALGALAVAAPWEHPAALLQVIGASGVQAT
jgi:DNA-binding response OmpR family regulator